MTKTILKKAFNKLMNINWTIADFVEPIPINTPNKTIFISVAGAAKDL
jgi:hypothetical protein